MATIWECDDDSDWRSGTFEDQIQWPGELFNGDYVMALMCIVKHIPAFQC